MSINQTFHGLSSPEELKNTWFNMTEGQDLPDLSVIWDFNEHTLNEFLKSDINCVVVNCLYKQNPKMVGHYVVLYKINNSIIYFDPLATFPQKWILDTIFNKVPKPEVLSKAKDFVKREAAKSSECVKIVIDLDGAQAINGNSCGFRCLFKLLKYCLGYNPHNFATILKNGYIVWNISKESKKKFIDTTINKTKREFDIIKNNV